MLTHPRGPRLAKVSVLAILALSTFALAPNSQARLGETFDQCQNRYGYVVRVETRNRADYPQSIFEKDGVEIRIRFLNGKSAQEIFTCGGAKMDSVAAEILTATAQGSTWSSTTVGNVSVYTRADGKVMAKYERSKSWRGNATAAVFTIQTTEFDRVFNAAGTNF